MNEIVVVYLNCKLQENIETVKALAISICKLFCFYCGAKEFLAHPLGFFCKSDDSTTV